MRGVGCGDGKNGSPPESPILTLAGPARPRVGARACKRACAGIARVRVREETTLRVKRKDVDLTERGRNLSVKA